MNELLAPLVLNRGGMTGLASPAPHVVMSTMRRPWALIGVAESDKETAVVFGIVIVVNPVGEKRANGRMAQIPPLNLNPNRRQLHKASCVRAHYYPSTPLTRPMMPS